MTRATANAGDNVIILGAHPFHGYSMNRYTELLVEGYRRAGYRIRLVRPTSALSKAVSMPALQKFVVYIESLVIFSARLALLRTNNAPVHIADHSDALWLCLPWRPRQAIVTCHDLIAVRAALGELPEHRTRRTGRFYQSLVRAGLERAGLILSVSGATQADVERLLPATPSRVLLNPLAPSMDPGETTPVSPSNQETFLLIVSSVGWRKRREKALSVWAEAAEASDSQLDAVIVGPPLTDKELDIAAKVSNGSVIIKNQLRDPELMGLYASALAVIQFSKYEGFGWPVIEANIHGTPAICADMPVLREIGPSNIFLTDDLGGDWAFIFSEIKSPLLRDAVQTAASKYRIAAFSDNLRRQIKAIQ